VLGAGRLAMCDPENDPAGRFGRQSLQSLDLWSVAAPRIAVTETAPAAVTMVDRGEVSAAVAFATDLHGDAHATIIGRFPSDSHGPIVYPVALTRNPPSPHAQAALDFLRSAEALRIFISFGYRAPG